MKALPYIRYSRYSKLGSRDASGLITLEEQDRTNDALALERGVDVLPERFVEPDTSAVATRPVFERALKLIADGKAGGIIVATFDRFSRDTADMLQTVRELESAGGRLICGDGDVTLSNGPDEFMATVRAAVSTFERRQRADYFKKSVRNAIERGVHLSAPFGYRKGSDLKLVVNGRDDDGKLVGEAAVVALAFELRAGGASWTVIADALNATGVLPRPRKLRKNGPLVQSRWTYKTARGLVIDREVYIGTAFNGEHRFPGAHEPLVDVDLYNAANRARGTKPNKREEGYLLTGLVRCASCGYAMTRHTNGKGAASYRCRSAQHADGECESPAFVNAAELESWVEEHFASEVLSIEVDAVASDDDVIAAKGRRSDAERLLTTRMRNRLDLGDDVSDAERRIADELVAEARAEFERRDVEFEQAQRNARPAALPADLDADGYNAAPVPERRHFLATAFACFVVRAGRRWREPVSGERVLPVEREKAPSDPVRLIPHVVALGW